MMVRGVDDAFCGVGMEVSRKRRRVLKVSRKRHTAGGCKIVDSVVVKVSRKRLMLLKVSMSKDGDVLCWLYIV